MTTATQKAPAAPPRPRAIDLTRMMNADFVTGEMKNITLPEVETIEEGMQDVERWKHLGPKLSMHQWLQITNDAGTMFRIMRVERLHASPGSGLRALVLRDVVPPKIIDCENEPIVATGDWYVRWGGPHRKWMVIMPNGNVRRSGINTEGEAKTVCHSESGNPKPL